MNQLNESLTTGQHVHNSDFGYGVVKKHNSRFAHVAQESGKETKHNQSDGFSKEAGFANPLRNSMTKAEIQKENLPTLDAAAQRHGFTHFGNDARGEHIYVDKDRKHRATSDSANNILLHHRLHENKLMVESTHFREFLNKHGEAMSKDIGSKNYHKLMADAYTSLSKHHRDEGSLAKSDDAAKRANNHLELSSK